MSEESDTSLQEHELVCMARQRAVSYDEACAAWCNVCGKVGRDQLRPVTAERIARDVKRTAEIARGTAAYVGPLTGTDEGRPSFGERADTCEALAREVRRLADQKAPVSVLVHYLPKAHEACAGTTHLHHLARKRWDRMVAKYGSQ